MSGTNDLESRPEVIQGHRFWYHRKCVYIHINPIEVNSNLDPVLYRFEDTAASMSKIPIATPIPAKI